jgi:hypothetical protein
LKRFIALGQSEIPAIVIEASQEDCYVMSLVENLARRHPGSLELMREIGALKDRGYTNAEIAAKIDFTADYISAIVICWNTGRSGSSSPSSAVSCRPISQWRLPRSRRRYSAGACRGLREQIAAREPNPGHSADHSAAQSAAKEPAAERPSSEHREDHGRGTDPELRERSATSKAVLITHDPQPI